MNLNIVRRINLLIFLVVSFNIWSAAQNNQIEIKGKVKDSSTNDVLPGATIVINNSTIGTTTNIDGEFTISIPDKGAELVISFIGYKTEHRFVENSSYLTILLDTDSKQIEDIVINVQAKGQKGAQREQLNSNTLKNVVASDRLDENPDANAVEAIGRLPGVSLLRSGGEGSGLVVRGLDPRYTAVTLNGIKMPDTDNTGRGTDLSSISQYNLQGVELYKALTPDMEANSVAGTVNLSLKEAPEGFKLNAMVQLGYNDLNSYVGNYKLQGAISNRFFDNKLGILLSLNAESVNRSTETMSASYGNESSNVDIRLSQVYLNKIKTTKLRRSAMLTVDFKPLPSTILTFNNLYAFTRDINQKLSKQYTVASNGNVSYNLHDNPYKNSTIFQSTLSGVTNLKFLNAKLDYGVSVSYGKVDDPNSRDWSFLFAKTPIDDDVIFTTEMRKKYPSELIPLFHDKGDSLNNLRLNSLVKGVGKSTDKNLTSYLNIKIPYNIGEIVNGYLKFGGSYRKKERLQNYTVGRQLMDRNTEGRQMLIDSLNWIVIDGSNNDISAAGLATYPIDNFLDGKYDYGWYLNFDKLNNLTDMWENISNYYYSQGENVWQPIFTEKSKIGFAQNIEASVMNDIDVAETYTAGYVMAEMNIGKWLMLLPGFRYEKTSADMNGFKATGPSETGPVQDPIPGNSSSAYRETDFLLPMLHARVKPLKWFYSHIAYTHTVSHPDLNSIAPNTYYYTGIPPFSYHANNPDLEVELWKNLDLQFTIHGSKVGLISLSGFYKTVDNKIWQRSYQRIKGDPIIEPFPDAALVNVSVWENHPYKVYLKGVELEAQTSFWYLPKPFKYFTFYGNYTFTDSETSYPYTKIENRVPPNGGRPVAVRIDSFVTGQMLYQPKHIANFSLGFNRKGLNVWLSFQYNGTIFTGKNYQVNELDPLKEYFYRWDLQITQQLSEKFKGFELIANFANLSNFTEVARLRGDLRPTSQESYGWTLDLGLRYKFDRE